MILHAARINFSLQHKTKGKRECFRWCMKWVKFADVITKPKITLCWLMNVDMVRLSLLISLLYSIFKKRCVYLTSNLSFYLWMKTLYGIFQHSVQMWENTDQKYSEHRLFLRSIFKRFQLFFPSFFWLWLTHFMLLVSFYTPRKHQKSRGGV